MVRTCHGAARQPIAVTSPRTPEALAAVGMSSFSAQKFTLRAEQDEVTQAVAVRSSGLQDLADRGAVGNFQFAAERVDEQLVHEASCKFVLPFDECLLEASDLLE